jgi:hypothetical protein
MTSRSRKVKRLRWVGITGLLCAAALALSGCWANVYNTGVNRHLVVGSKATNQFIFICTGLNPNDAFARTRCVMSLLRQTCLQQQEGGDQPWTDQNCYESTDPNQVDVVNVNSAIGYVTTQGADCLEIVHQRLDPYNVWVYTWGAVNRGTSTACTFADS